VLVDHHKTAFELLDAWKAADKLPRNCKWSAYVAYASGPIVHTECTLVKALHTLMSYRCACVVGVSSLLYEAGHVWSHVILRLFQSPAELASDRIRAAAQV